MGKIITHYCNVCSWSASRFITRAGDSVSDAGPGLLVCGVIRAVEKGVIIEPRV